MWKLKIRFLPGPVLMCSSAPQPADMLAPTATTDYPSHNSTPVSRNC